MFKNIYIHKRQATTPESQNDLLKAVKKLTEICSTVGSSIIDHPKDADIIIALGGDGTVLAAAQLAIKYNKPIAGVYAGKLGFMTSYHLDEADEITELLKNPGIGHTLDTVVVSHNNKTYHAVNECLLHRTPNEQIGQISIQLDNEIFQLSADGMMVTTATGSSGYALSSGGPLIHPSSSQMLLIAVAPHSLNARPMVLPENANIIMKQLSTIGTLYIDGIKVSSVIKNDHIICSSAQEKVVIHHPASYNYYSRIIHKLHWQSSQ